MAEIAVVSTLLAYALVLLVALMGLVAFGWAAGYGAGRARGRKDAARRGRHAAPKEESPDE